METLKQAVCLKPWVENSTRYQPLPESEKFHFALNLTNKSLAGNWIFC